MFLLQNIILNKEYEIYVTDKSTGNTLTQKTSKLKDELFITH